MTAVGNLINYNRGGVTRVLRSGKRVPDRRPLHETSIPVEQLEVRALAHMAASPDNDLRRAVVEHPDCPPHLLEQLADDTDAIVVIQVARHRNCPPRLLAQLTKCRTWQVRYEVARHPATPGDCLLTLLNDNNKGVRQRCASRRPMPQWLIDAALAHTDPVVRHMATVEEPW